MIDLSSLSNEELIALYKKTDREVKEGNKEGCGKGEGTKLYPIMILKPKLTTTPRVPVPGINPRGTVPTVSELDNVPDPQNGDLYVVKENGEGYVYESGTWVITGVRVVEKPGAKPPQEVVDAIFCPGKNKENAYAKLPDVRETMVQELVRMAVNIGGGETGARVAEKLATTPLIDEKLSTTPLIEPVHVSNCPEPNPPKKEETSYSLNTNDLNDASLIESPTPTPSPTPSPNQDTGGYY